MRGPDYTGLTMEEARDWGWTAAIHPEDLSDLTDRWRAMIASKAKSDRAPNIDLGRTAFQQCNDKGSPDAAAGSGNKCNRTRNIHLL